MLTAELAINGVVIVYHGRAPRSIKVICNKKETITWWPCTLMSIQEMSLLMVPKALALALRQGDTSEVYDDDNTKKFRMTEL